VLTCAHGGGLLSRLILWGDREPGEPASRASHAAMIARPNASDWRDSILIESTWPRVRECRSIRFYLERDAGVVIYRHTGLDAQQRSLLLQIARNYLGERYGAGNLLWFAADALVNKSLGWTFYALSRPLRSLLGLGWRWPRLAIFSRLNLARPIVCSQLVALAYQAIGMRASSLDWAATTPDDIDDFCAARSDRFERIV